MKHTSVIADLLRNPAGLGVANPLKFFKFLILNSSFLILFAACSDNADPATGLGTIMFTSNVDCEIRLFAANNGEQLARDFYEVGKEPIVIQMKSTGIFVLNAESPGKKTKKEPLAYNGGNMEHYIEF
jgi:hypothetical protein